MNTSEDLVQLSKNNRGFSLEKQKRNRELKKKGHGSHEILEPYHIGIGTTISSDPIGNGTHLFRFNFPYDPLR